MSTLFNYRGRINYYNRGMSLEPPATHCPIYRRNPKGGQDNHDYSQNPVVPVRVVPNNR